MLLEQIANNWPLFKKWHWKFKLKTGEFITIRPFAADDKELLRQALFEASRETTKRRFQLYKNDFTQVELKYLTEPDLIDHFALCAINSAGKGIASVRMVRAKDDDQCAEVAVVVTDAYQGEGLGLKMLQAISKVAKEVGIEYFKASVERDNTAMLSLVKKYATYKIVNQDASSIEVRTSLFK